MLIVSELLHAIGSLKREKNRRYFMNEQAKNIYAWHRISVTAGKKLAGSVGM